MKITNASVKYAPACALLSTRDMSINLCVSKRWITLVETIFRRRGQARQELMDTWLTETTPVRSWREKLKDAHLENSSQGGEEGIS